MDNNNPVRMIAFIAEVTEYDAQRGVDYTTKQLVQLLVHSDQQTIILHGTYPVEEGLS